MARIKIILEDDQGNVINSKELNYDLNLQDGKFHTLEGEIDKFKKSSSKEITALLLTQMQKELKSQKKNEGWALNGSRTVSLRSLHGRFEFSMQKFKRTGEYCNFFDFMNEFGNQSYISERLKEYACWLSLGNSYEKVEQILDRHTYSTVLSSNKIQQIVTQKAIQISKDQAELVKDQISKEMPAIAAKVNIYQKNNEELLVFEDGVLVKGQKYHRRSANRAAPSDKGKKKRPVTDIALLPTKNGQSSYLIGGIGLDAVQLDQVMQGHIKEHFRETKKPLRLVCITDGASQIHIRYKKAFGLEPIRILDWFHLKKKVNELGMMICFGKEKKKQAVKDLLTFLWVGDKKNALHYLETKVEVRNKSKHTELINYLTKHGKAIINYERRQKAGKIIGSGCIETSVKQAVAIRQKKQGMTWVPMGSSALAILTVQKMNGLWDSIWAFN